jgi:hypothetical protein
MTKKSLIFDLRAHLKEKIVKKTLNQFILKNIRRINDKRLGSYFTGQFLPL